MTKHRKYAMTHDQWSDWLGEQAQTRIEDENGDVLVLCRDKSGKVSDWGGINHATAAAALHAKPFGFTGDDAALLRQIAPFVVGSSVAQPDLREWAHDLATRIEALLAPERAV